VTGVTNQNPLRPDEDEYRTEIATDEVEEDTSTAANASPPWVLLAVLFLVIFVAVLVWAVVLPGLG